MKKPQQTDLFGNAQVQETPNLTPEAQQAGAVIVIAGGSAGLNAHQRTFNKLSLEIDAERARLLEWQTFSGSLGVKIEHEYDPAMMKLRASKRRFIILSDQVFQQSLAKGGKKLTKRRKNTLREAMLSIISELEPLPGEADDEALDAIFERYAGFSAVEQREMEMERVESFLIDELGIEAVQGHNSESLEELLMHAREKMAQADATRSENRESRRAERQEKSGRVSPAAARKAAAEQDMKKTVREIYRKLASDLHPDREPDLVERARKTALMQRINAAYEANNLLELLTLQMEVAQLSELTLSAIPAERLKNFIQVLNEQLKTLKSEVRDIRQRFGATFDLAPFEYPKTVAAATQIFGEVVADILEIEALVDYDCGAIADLAQRDQCIDRMM